MQAFDAFEASRQLINLTCEAPDNVPPELRPIIDLALKAYGLPQDFPEQVLINELNADQEHHHD
ncbi:hypothetical protein [Bradyrhizobium sp. SZCCHNS3053]|uniref:hypothetical protein n=1 Tax=Bradyrhizobium sp. SZCCHNS3053 TaxID=3057322 RepID=UPI002916DAE6|nr:hypothetical protein [Bradyrhizobium sp. SZCCHNS3053]